ncbi:MAG: DUF559 domain-containing protein [Candidatus Kapaibacterium sp.]|nr:DUF559 domain-containing protein [Ignavibacteria bacterium]
MPRFRRSIIPATERAKQYARELRNNSTFSEVLLWKHLKGKQMCGYDFHRQKPIFNYIVDFFAPDLMLVVEVDGSSHRGKEAYDVRRQKEIERLGICFLRFAERNVQHDLEVVLQEIREWIEERNRID